MLFVLSPKKIIVGIIIFLSILTYYFTISSPVKFPKGAIFNVREGAGLLEVAHSLKNQNIIRSEFWFRSTTILLGGERRLKAGDYYLNRRENALNIAWRIVHGKREIKTIKLTIPEGYTKKEISNLFDQRFPKFDKIAFLQSAKEGYLFPDTYFIEVSATASSTINLLTNNFKIKIEALNAEIASSTHSEEDIIKMASILEGEAKTLEDREIVSGILWKRLDMGMPLQVDATLKYVTGRGTSDLTTDDLNIDSPYNSYKRIGLPPTPISNPGIEAITAALRPTKTPYLYFLTDNNGVMHYSKNFEEHKKNKEKYLNN